MKISIITINFNNSEGLAKTIKSVTDQTYNNIEYIVIDGGSTDNSTSVVNSYKSKISYFVSEPDNGIFHAMNKGIMQASGDYLLFLNSGDRLIDELVVQNVVEKDLNKDLVYGDLLFFDEHKEWIWKLRAKLTFNDFFKGTIPHPSTFIKKQLFDNVGYYDEKLKIVSDWKFFILATAKFNCTYKHIPILITAYNFDGLSSKPENSALIDKERSLVLNEDFPFFIENYNDLIYLKNEMNQIKYFTKIRNFFKNVFKVDKSS